MQFNQIMFSGRLTKDPEYKEVGTGLAKFDVAVNKSYKNKDGSWGQDTMFMNDVDLWGKYAKDVASRFHKGDQVFVVGEFSENEWSDKETGKKRKKIVVKVNKIIACGGKQNSVLPNEEPDF